MLEPEVYEFSNLLAKDQWVAEYWLLTGSRIICNPPVEDTDIDIVFIYNAKFSLVLQEAGFTITPHQDEIYPNQEIAACYRKGKCNLIAVRTKGDYDRWEAATKLATALNLQQKEQRVKLFQYMTEGKIR